MKLRAVELGNVRRFAGKRAVLSGIGDGITLLCEPNEFGKSTFFDALHALFFERHRSTRAPVRSLQPHAGGGPEVTVDMDLPEGRFRVSKKWLQGARMQVLDPGGRLIAQADEAEAWLDRLIGGDLSGPSGLLWVRQGLLGMEPDGAGTEEKRERERGLATRRDLLSSVAGEIEMMTGGRRMDAVLERVAQEIARLATGTGKPRAGGEWARASDDATRLAAEEAELRAKAASLSGDLARRSSAQRDLARLTDPADAAARAEDQRRAEAAHAAALAHQDRIRQAEAAENIATLGLQKEAQDLERLQALVVRLDRAREALDRAQERAATAAAAAEELNSRDIALTDAAEQAGHVTRDLRLRLARANRERAARAAQARAEDLRRRLDRAAEVTAGRDAAKGRRALIAVTPRSLEAAEAAQVELDRARARAEAQAVTVDARPEGAARASIGGRPLDPGPHPIRGLTDIDLPGFGTLRIDPGQSRAEAGAADVAKATAAMDRALAECRAENLTAARTALAEARDLDAAVAGANALLAEIAPDGLDRLRTALAQAEAEGADVTGDAEDADRLTDALSAAEDAEAQARAAATATHRLAVSAREVRAAAEADRMTAERRLSEAQAEAGDAADLSAAIAAGQARLPALRKAQAQAAAALAALQAEAPDIATAEARLRRANSAVQQAAQDIARRREELAALDATIRAMADEGIEERLSAVSGERAEAEARAARYQAEHKALTRLQRALDDSRKEARDAYFGPVVRELQPLLSILYPGAALKIDDKTLLPDRLVRNGVEEPIDILSGGTREQVAILTRLAFARLFSAAGRPVPVILDDALVHSDDDRIEAMFTALHRTARDQQILVLTCRQRAFGALGGDRAHVRIEDL